MWTWEQVRDADFDALAKITPEQKAALDRVHRAENMAHFTAATFAMRLEQQFRIEADLRNGREAEERVEQRRAGIHLVTGS